MRILIIEDNSLKAEDIKKCISQNIVDVSIDVEQAFNTGVRRAYKENYDFIIIDNSLPYYANDMNDICPDVASIILENLEEEIIGKCIICSAFEKGEKENYFSRLVDRYSICIGFIRYDPCEDDWRNQIISLINGTN